VAEQHRQLKSRREAVRRRRLVALAVLVLVLVAVGSVAGYAVSRRAAEPAPPPAPPPPPKPFRIVFPEGFTREEMADRVAAVAGIARRTRHANVRLARSTYLAGSRRAVVPCFGRKQQRNLEGFLFPATYDFLRDTSSRQLVLDQIETFCDNWRKLDLSYARSKNLTPYDVLTIASMIEKEARVASERRLVAAVVYNRLHARMTLGIDATLRYGLHIAPTQSILRSQLESPTPYNTRLHTGLPPTPISNPGLAAMQAAAHPAKVDYLFYARKPDHMHHFFTASQAEFDRFLATHGYG
jgi:peptidoglycan lytic transglycosylase G